MLVGLILPQRSLRLSLVLFILFTLFCSSEVSSTILSSSSLIHFLLRHSASDSFLSIFNFGNCVLSLYVYSLIFLGLCWWILQFSPFCFQGFCSSLLTSFWILFPVVCLFPLHLFGLCVTSLFFHLYSISLPFHYFFLNLLCLRSPFPRLQGWIPSFFWFLPS